MELNIQSPYASPVLLVNKLNKIISHKRLRINYRKLNKQLIDLPYPIPDIDEELNALSSGRIFATLDMANGYLQIPLIKESK